MPPHIHEYCYYEIKYTKDIWFCSCGLNITKHWATGEFDFTGTIQNKRSFNESHQIPATKRMAYRPDYKREAVSQLHSHIVRVF